MSIGFNNSFGKLTTQQQTQAKKLAEEKQPNVQDNTKTEIQKAGEQLNKSVISANQKDLIASFIDKIGDIDDGKLEENEPEVKENKPKEKKGSKPLTEKEKGWLREMQNEGCKDPDWAAGAAVCFIISRIYHRIKGD